MDLLENEENKESIVTLEDFPFICRICCSKRSDLRLFQEENYLWDLFNTIRKVDVHSTGFPKNVCTGCINKLESISLFIDPSKDDNDASFGKKMQVKKDHFECTNEIESDLSEKAIGMIEENVEDMFLQRTQICRLCSADSLMPFEEKIHLIHLFGNTTNINVKTEFSDSKMDIICNKCNNELEKISSFVTSSLCNDQKLEFAIERNITVKTEDYSDSIDNETLACQDSIIGGNEEMTECVEEIPFLYESKVKPEIIDIKEEIIDHDLVTSDNVVHLRTGSFDNPFIGDCKRSFAKKSDLQKHMLTHNVEKPFKCDICQKCFANKKYLQKHMLTHSAEKPFKCGSCEKRFTRKFILNVHMRTHTGEKRFKCDSCDKKFTRNQSLQWHMLTHSAEKPYKCGSCEKRFTRKFILNVHMRTHTGEKRFKCDSCDKKFTRNQSLQWHMLTHSGEKQFKCYSCNKYFTNKKYLQQHMTHRREKRFKCDKCGKKFSQKNYLQKHMLTHEKPFKCNG